MKTCIHVYYGTGKGKTTAAVGLAVRAAGAGCPVLFCQFLKSGETAELNILRTVPGLKILRPEHLYPFTKHMTAAERAAITAEHNGILRQVGSCLSSMTPEDSSPVLVVMDELAWAFHYELIDRDAVLNLLDSGKARKAEFVITGRVGVPELLERADYVTNLQEEKHPYQQGLPARRGVEF